MPYDLFISYSRKDNVNNRVTELKNQIETDYLEFAKEPLTCFFDQEEIKGMDDWQFRLLQGLKDSHLLLVILSPNYLASPYCEWEIVEYLKYEYSRGVAGDGVAQVYFMEIPGIDDEDFRAKAAAWLEKVSRRQRIDLRPWRDEGADSLKRMDVKKRLVELKESLRKSITRMRVISDVPGNLPAPNPRFVGREREMEMLHKATALGQMGVIAAVHGVGGLGKTAIAFQYAYAYANFYPGGRWYLGCANETSLASVIKRLDVDLNITLTEDEKKDEIRGAKRILNELYNRAVENAEKANNRSNATTSDKEYSKPAVLLILDNVDHPELIQPPCSDIISGKEWLKIIATTRMGPEELGDDESSHKLLTIDELPFEDGVRLLESYQPGGRFVNIEEKAKAGEIVKLLGGFTLAVEVAALYLYEKKGRVSCAEFLEILKAKGVDFAGENTKKQLSHTKLISATLAPTLDSLSPEETLILSYASLLPPDSIPLPWLKALVVKKFPHLDEEEMAGIDNPWISTINHLLSIRLFQIVDLDGQLPRLMRMHRLIGEYVRNKQKDNLQKFQDELTDSIKIRCNELEFTWHQYKWEILPIVKYVKYLIEIQDPKIPKLVRALCQWLTAFDRGIYSESILKATIAYLEAYPSNDKKDLSVAFSNLGGALNSLGKHEESESYLRRAIEIDEGLESLDEHALAVRYANLGSCLSKQGKYAEARNKAQIAVDLSTRSVGIENQTTMACIMSLAIIERRLGNLKEAKELNLKAFKIIENIFDKDHPQLANCYSQLADVEMDIGNTIEAKKLYLKSIAIDEKNLEKDHPDLAISYFKLAKIEMEIGNLKQGKELAMKAIDIFERNLEKDHPYMATGYSILASLEEKLGNMKEAKELHLKAISIREKKFAKDNPFIASSYNDLASIEMTLGNMKASKELYQKAIEMWEKVYEKDHPDLASGYSNFAVLEQALGNLKVAESLFRKALDIRIKSLPPRHSKINSSYTLLADLLDKTGQKEEAKELRLRSLEYEQNEITPIDLRKRALEYFNLGDYFSAEKLLIRVLAEKFELPGTHCHLSRIYILTDRLLEANEHINEAWQHYSEASIYVNARILWFKIALSFLTKSSIENYIGQLKTILQKEDAFMEWTMQPVLDHIKPKLTERQYALLTALVAAMSDMQNLEKLNDFEEWRDAKLEEIE